MIMSTKVCRGSVQKCLHLIAAHELWMNFPVTQIGGAQEVMMPGCIPMSVVAMAG